MRLYRVRTALDKYLGTFEEGEETPTDLSGCGQCKSWLLIPFYDI